MIFFRLLRIVWHLLVASWICATIFPFVGPTQRMRRIQRWSAQLLLLCRVSVALDHRSESALDMRALWVSNHVSWLDIFVINSMCPCRFVAKSDIRDWPLIGWICARAGTVFIARGRLRDMRRTFQDLLTSIRNDERIAFFPEGTTAAQGGLLPFHPNLFEAAIDAQVPVRPCAVRYTDPSGNMHPDVDFIGEMTFAQSLLAILGGPRIAAQVIVLPLIASDGVHRRELAAQARDVIGDALGRQS